ncbi:DNA gyrase inhibitor YacG [Methylogaea oryzae]|nr:DNA gyrase inhibitor YacG [Methylogaea oryzae]
MPESAAVYKIVKCPTCRKPVPWLPSQRYRPFCSERCKLIDLGEWANEGHVIPGEPLQEEPATDDGTCG